MLSLDTQKFVESVQGCQRTLKQISEQTPAERKPQEYRGQLGVIKADPQLTKWSVLSQTHIELVLKVYTSAFSETFSRTDYVIEAFTRQIENECFNLNEAFSEFRKTLLKPLAEVLIRILASRREI